MAVAWIEIIKFRGQQLKSNLGLFGFLSMLAFSVGGLLMWHTQDLTAQMSEVSRGIFEKKEFLNSNAISSTAHVTKFELPLVGTYESILKSIILLIEKNTITLVGGSYTVKTFQNSKIKIIEITFPLSGTYFQVKHFLAELMNTVPNASLQTFKVSQPNKTSELLDAEVVILLYFLGNTSQ